MGELVIGGGADVVRIRVIKRFRPTDNWLRCEIEVKAGSIRAAYEADLESGEFERLRRDLRPAYESLRGTAELASMEGWIVMQLTGDGIGHFAVKCWATESHSPLRSIEFEMEVDQTQVLEMLQQLETLLREFPVVGERRA